MVKTVSQVRDEISHLCDGPVTQFVLIARAMEAAKSGDPEVAANALYQELLERGYVEREQIG